MRTTKRHLTQVTIAIGALALAMTTPTQNLGDSGPALAIRAVAVHGNEVAITVANPTTRPQTGTVSSQVLTSRGTVDAMTQVTAAAGQTVTVTIVMPAPVLEVLPLGVVVDDGVPF